MENQTTAAQAAARDLLSIRAVFLRPDEPFTWASGIKSPIYCDNRLLLSFPQVRTRIEDALAQMIQREYPNAQALAGTATAGIAHAALAAERLALPMCYVRASAKDHGRNNQIEGRLQPGARVVVVEDLISTGGSVIEVVKVLQAAGFDVLGIASLFTYGLAAGVEKLAAAGVKNVSLTNYDTLILQAAQENYVTQKDLAKLRAFRQNPKDPAWMQA